MLRAFCWLVSNVVSTCRTIFNRRNRDWHTDEAEDDHLPTPNDPIQKEAQTSQPSFSGKRKARIPGIPVASTQGTMPHSRCATNQDARHKAEHDSLDDQEAELQLRVPGEGRGQDSAQRADTQPECATRTDWTPAFAGDTACDTRARSPLIPTKVGIQGGRRTLSRLAASTLRTQHTHSRIPTHHPERVEGRRNERYLLRIAARTHSLI